MPVRSAAVLVALLVATPFAAAEPTLEVGSGRSCETHLVRGEFREENATEGNATTERTRDDRWWSSTCTDHGLVSLGVVDGEERLAAVHVGVRESDFAGEGGNDDEIAKTTRPCDDDPTVSCWTYDSDQRRTTDSRRDESALAADGSVLGQDAALRVGGRATEDREDVRVVQHYDVHEGQDYVADGDGRWHRDIAHHESEGTGVRASTAAADARADAGSCDRTYAYTEDGSGTYHEEGGNVMYTETSDRRSEDTTTCRTGASGTGPAGPFVAEDRSTTREWCHGIDDRPDVCTSDSSGEREVRIADARLA